MPNARVLHVAPGEPSAFPSISAAIAESADGDTIAVDPGAYSPSTTGETLPIFVPNGVSVRGSGAGVSILDAEGALTPTWRPVRFDQSALVLGDRSALSGFTVQNSGGIGVSIRPGSSAVVSGNEIVRNAQHAIFAVGCHEALIFDNVLAENGTNPMRYSCYRLSGAELGQSVLCVAQPNARNRVIISHNHFRNGNDAVTLFTDYDETRGVHAKLLVYANRIEDMKRAGIILGMFGPGDCRVSVEISRNDLARIGRVGVLATGAVPFTPRLVQRNVVQVAITDNAIDDCGEGLVFWGAFGPAQTNVVDATILRNRIANARGNGIHMTAGFGGARGDPAVHNVIRARIWGNHFSSVQGASILAEAGATEGPKGGMAKDNGLELRIDANVIPATAENPGVVLNRGGGDNWIRIAAPTPPYRAIHEPIVFSPTPPQPK